MRYNIAAMTKRATKRRRQSITLRPIEPTATMAGDLYRVAFRPVIQAWQQAIVTISGRYEAALPVRDSIHDAVFDLDAILASIEGSLQQLVVAITPRLQQWSVRAELWHRGKFRGAVLAGTGIDPQAMLGSEDVSDTVAAFVSRNVSLIKSVAEDTRTKVADIVLRGYASRTPLRQVAKEMSEAVDFSRKRSLRIAVHQNSSLAARLDQARQEQAGISEFQYHHGAPKHPRSWHAARNGKLYEWSTMHEVGGPDVIKPGDEPGAPPGCTCRTRAHIDLS